MTDPVQYTVDGTSLRQPWCWIRPSTGTLSVPTARGSDLVVPEVAGEEPLDRVAGATFDTFIVSLTGRRKPDGTPTPLAQREAAWLTHVRWLQDLLGARTGLPLLSVEKAENLLNGPKVYGPVDCRCVSDLTPVREGPAFGHVIVRLKVYGGWGDPA